MLGASWYIRLLGGLFAERDGHPLVRFQTRKTGGLLAYLAFHLPDVQARDLLIEQFWPELDIVGGRNGLAVALSSLRRQLEPPDIAPGSVIISTRLGVRMNADAVRTDVQAFRQLAETTSENDLEDPVAAAVAALSLYRGYLLPGCYDDWAGPERERLASHFVRIVSASVEALESQGDLEQALDHAIAASGAAPDHEACHRDVIRLYMRMDRKLEALRQYKTLEERMREEWGRGPSRATRDLLKGIGVDPLAVRRLKNKARKLRASVAPELSAPQPAAAPASVTWERTDATLPPLPKPLARFFGREDEISQLSRLLSPPDHSINSGDSFTARLTTITGPAGAGKTRLALETAQALSAAYDGNVAFAALSNISDPLLIHDVLLSAIGQRQGEGIPSDEQLISSLAGRRFLLVLDNAEHLGDAVAGSVCSLLAALPKLALLVTSRVPLGVGGERLLPLAPMPTPTQPGTPERLMEFACVRMFVDRAQAVSPDFQITPRNAAAVAAVCDKLEGMPLAIELAAARTSALTPAQMLGELDRRFGFLVSRQRTVEGRHRTLEAALEWSYDLLPEPTRRFFSRLSLFRGGWTLEAARAIWQEIDDEENALDHLERLVQQALISTEDLVSGKRFRMLESVREFAELRLAPDDREVTRNLLARYLVHLAEEEAPNMRGPNSSETVAKLQPELANFRWLLSERSEKEDGLRLSAALWRLWSICGQAEEGAERLRTALRANSGADVVLRIEALTGLGVLLRYLRSYEAAREAVLDAVRLARESHDAAGLADALNVLSVIVDEQGESLEARRLLEESLDLRRATGDNWSIAAALNNLARITQREGDLHSARRFYEECHERFKMLEDWSAVSMVLLNLGVTADELGDYTAARAAYEQSLMIFRQLGNRREIGVVLYNLGEAMTRECAHPEAPRYFCESIQARIQLGDRAGVALPLVALANIATREGDFVRAVRLHAAATVVAEKWGVVVNWTGRHDAVREVEDIQRAMTKQDFDAAWEFGRSLTLEQAAVYAADGVRSSGVTYPHSSTPTNAHFSLASERAA